MRSVSATIQQAITNPTSYQMTTRVVIEPSRVFFESIDSNFPPGGIAESTGLPDSLLLQDIVYHTGLGIVTFLNDGDVLKYMKQGSATVISTGQAIKGKPGLTSDYIYLQDSNNDLRRFALDWTTITAGGAGALTGSTLVSAYTSGSLACNGISDTEVVAFENADGGVRANYHEFSGSWVKHAQGNRFMFPKAVVFTSSRDIYNMMACSTGLRLGDSIFAYISNANNGKVQGVEYSRSDQTWSDIFDAVPSDIDTSLAESRVVNSFVYGSTAYLVYQMMRREGVQAYQPYSMISRSMDGRNYSLDRFVAVSSLGYRFLATVGSDLKLYISNCNRVSSKDATYLYLDSSASAPRLSLPEGSILRFQDTANQSGVLDLKAGNNVLLFHSYVAIGSRVKVYVGYKTSLGLEDILYGTYIIASVHRGIAEGDRILSVNLTAQSIFFLEGMSSPYYTEINSKDSLFTLTPESGYLYTAGSSGTSGSGCSVDFWNSDVYDDLANGIIGRTFLTKGGVDYVDHLATQKIGVISEDLKDHLGLEEHPRVSETSIAAKIYGWSHAYVDQYNDQVTCLLKFQRSDKSTYLLSQTGSRWPNTYPSSASGDLPINYTFPGAVIGDSLTNVALVFGPGGTYSSGSVACCPSRVDITTGVITKVGKDNNSGWTTSGSAIEIPGYGRPYIMLSRNPYNAFNFQISAEFEDTVGGYIVDVDYPVGWGLVGLAMDGGNYICGRYNKSVNKLEIVKARERSETVLASATPTSSINQRTSIMFEHRDGLFTIRILDGLTWISNLTYTWQDADGWMFPGDSISVMHVGIYGIIKTPSFSIVGFDPGGEEEITNATGFPILPGNDLTVLSDFPTSGSCAVEENIYSYSSKVIPAEVRGPYQFRQSSRKYKPPTGTGEPGIETRDFDWTKANGSYTGYFAAVDDGGCYPITDSDWTVYHRTGGVSIAYPNRLRLYGDEKMGSAFHDLSNRTYITGGLAGVSLLLGEASYHPRGETCRYHTTGTIKCYWFAGSDGNIDATVEDLIERISENAGAVAQFPGDITSGSFVATSGSPISIGSKEFPDGLDLLFTGETLTSGSSLSVIADATFGGDSQVRVQVRRTGTGTYELSAYKHSSSTPIESYAFGMADSSHQYRFLFHDNFITVYVDDFWIYTFHLQSDLTYASSMGVYLYVQQSGMTISDLVLKDLSDWRGAIYIDLETNARSAVSSVIQERPIELAPRSNGAIDYVYDPVRQSLAQEPKHLYRHEWDDAYPDGSSSDAIIYYSDVALYQFVEYLRDFGFATKVYRTPNMEAGAVRAAKITIRREYERSHMHNLDIRPNIRLETGDILSVTYDTSGAVNTVTFSVIIESILLIVIPPGGSSGPSMGITGRQYSGA